MFACLVTYYAYYAVFIFQRLIMAPMHGYSGGGVHQKNAVS